MNVIKQWNNIDEEYYERQRMSHYFRRQQQYSEYVYYQQYQQQQQQWLNREKQKRYYEQFCWWFKQKYGRYPTQQEATDWAAGKFKPPATLGAPGQKIPPKTSGSR